MPNLALLDNPHHCRRRNRRLVVSSLAARRRAGGACRRCEIFRTGTLAEPVGAGFARTLAPWDRCRELNALLLNARGNIVGAAPPAETWLGAGEPVAPGVPFARFVLETSTERWERAWFDLTSRAERIDGLEIELDTPGGESTWHRAALSSVVGTATGEPLYLGLFAPLNAADEVNPTDAAIHRLDLLARLVGGLAHDLNNQVTSLLGHTALVRAALPADDAAMRSTDALELIAHQISRSARAIHAALRTDDTGVRDIDLAAFAREFADTARFLLSSSRRVECSFPDGESYWIAARPADVQQVLLQLLLSTGAAQQGVTPVTMRLAREPADAGAEEATAVFSILTGPPGSGLSGYATLPDPDPHAHLIAAIAARFGGECSVDAGPAGFVRAILQVPCTVADRATPNETSRAGVGASARAIVAEAHPQVRQLLRKVLTDCGLAVVDVCDCGALDQAVSASAGEAVLLVVDADLPQLRLAPWLSARRAGGFNAPVIVTAGGAVGELSTIESLGGHVLRKPFRLADLSNLVHRLSRSQPGTRTAT